MHAERRRLRRGLSSATARSACSDRCALYRRAQLYTCSRGFPQNAYGAPGLSVQQHNRLRAYTAALLPPCTRRHKSLSSESDSFATSKRDSLHTGALHTGTATPLALPGCVPHCRSPQHHTQRMSPRRCLCLCAQAELASRWQTYPPLPPPSPTVLQHTHTTLRSARTHTFSSHCA